MTTAAANLISLWLCWCQSILCSTSGSPTL